MTLKTLFSTQFEALALRPIAAAAALSLAPAMVWAQTNTPSTAGTIEFAQGNVSVRTPQGQVRSGQRGTIVVNGETVETGNGRAQMRMVDGAYISLQNDTALRLDNYRVANASTNESESALMSLVRGGLRTVTGLIGRSNKQNYKLQTATATIGIRGTGFLATAAEDGTRVRVSEGAIALCNTAGCLNLDSLQSGFAPTLNTMPVRIAQAPSLQPVQAPSVVLIAPIDERRLVVEVAESRSEPIPIPSGPPRIPLSNPSAGLIVVFSNSSNPLTGGVIGGTLTYDAEGRMLTFVDGTYPTGYATTAAAISDFGSDGIVAWGRWNGGNTTYSGNPTASLSHLTYVTGNTGAAVPIVGTYTAFGSTSPLVINSSNGGVLQVGTSNAVTGSMNVNFTGPSGGSLSYNLNIPVGGQTFNMVGTANQYAGTNFLGNTSNISSSGSGCSATCTGLIPYGDAIQGAFFGAGNSRAGAQYGFSSGVGNISGAVVFRSGN